MFYLTADTHFGHNNIIRYCNRPFNTVDEMDDKIIENWNNVVTNEDIVYVLGDFAFNNFKTYVDRLNGTRIYLLPGDHDKSAQNYGKLKITDTTLNLKFNGGTSVTLSHWCYRVWHASHYNSFHAFGHSHGRLEPVGKSWDVGVDNNDFKPISIGEFIFIMGGRPNNINFIGDK